MAPHLESGSDGSVEREVRLVVSVLVIDDDFVVDEVVG